MKIAVIGSGYVGLVTGACFADLGVYVTCVDVDADKVQRLSQGEVPIYEPGLEGLIQPAMANGRLRFTTELADAMTGADVVFIAVGTPSDEDGSADLQYVLQAAREIGAALPRAQPFTVVVDKSTVPVGTADQVHQAIQDELDRQGVQHRFAVVSNPEFLKEGAAVADFMRPDRIVLGIPPGEPGHLAREVMDRLYAPLQRNHPRTYYMDVRSAELTKYAANAMLATRISFMNDLSNLADAVGADIESVRRGIGSDSRIGFDFLYAGTGYGGSCFPKDIRAIGHTARQQGIELRLVQAVEAINQDQKAVLVRKIQQQLGQDLSGRHFALWGLAFKPNTDDMRDAPSRAIIRQLLDAGATITAHDPVAMAEARRALAKDLADIPNALGGPQPRVRFVDQAEQALEGADALVIATEWKMYRTPDFDQMRRLLKAPRIFDGRNLYSPQEMVEAGFAYVGIGRGRGELGSA